MTWAFKNLGTKTSGATTSAVNVAYPASIAANDTIWLRCATAQANDSFTVSDAGFVLLTSRTDKGTVYLFAKPASGSESGNFTVTCSSNYRAFYNTALFSGGPTANLPSNTVTASTFSGGATNIVTPALTITNAGTLVVVLGGKITNGTSITAPSGFTMLDQDNSTAPGCCAWAYQIQTTASNISADHFTVGAGDSSVANDSVMAAMQPLQVIVPYPPMNLGGMNVQICQ